VHVEAIEDLAGFARLRESWERTYALDPDAHVFLSWSWMADHLACSRAVWRVLAVKRARSDAAHVGFLHLRTLVRFQPGRGFETELRLLGDGFTCYTGVLLQPDCEAEAIAALSDYVERELAWTAIRIEHPLVSARRRRLLLQAFNRPRCRLAPLDMKFADGTDNDVCPYAALPSDWDAYLAGLSANNRQKIRRLLRRLESSTAHRIALAEPGSVDRDIDALLEMWRAQWGAGRNDPAGLVDQMRAMLLRCGEAGALVPPVFRCADRPVAALALVADRPRRALRFLASGRDAGYQDLPAGYLLHAWCIREAIAMGFATYDFMQGNEPYKRCFTDQELWLGSMSVRARLAGAAPRRWDPKALGVMLQEALGLETQGRAADAELAYRQIVALAPNDALALYRLGRFLAERGDHAEARRLLERSVAIEPGGDNAWRRLARCLVQLGERAAALEACRRLLALRPGDAEAGRLVLQLSGEGRRPVAVLAPAADLRDARLDPDWVRRQFPGLVAGPGAR
jgi:tetratricopeptide (TPR) repeat protein